MGVSFSCGRVVYFCWQRGIGRAMKEEKRELEGEEERETRRERERKKEVKSEGAGERERESMKRGKTLLEEC